MPLPPLPVILTTEIAAAVATFATTAVKKMSLLDTPEASNALTVCAATLLIVLFVIMTPSPNFNDSGCPF